MTHFSTTMVLRSFGMMLGLALVSCGGGGTVPGTDATALRPLLGPAGPTVLPTEKKFFLAHWMDNLDGRTPPKY